MIVAKCPILVFSVCVTMVFSYSDGVWDPEKWHASLYPTSERNSPVESFKKDFVDDRVPLKRRIPGKWHGNLTLHCRMFFIKEFEFSVIILLITPVCCIVFRSS